MSAGQILVAGVGNIFLGDDGFGPEVVRRLPARSGVRIVDYGIRGMHLAYDLLDGYRALVLVDLLPRAEPGEVRTVEVTREDLSGGSFDAHSMDPAAVLATLEALGGVLPRTFVIGCRPVSVEERLGLTDEVSIALDAGVQAVDRLLAVLVDEPAGARP